MASRALIEEAKQIVLSHGPSNCLEFTSEIVTGSIEGSRGSRSFGHAELSDEVRKQAGRVYEFLGFVNPIRES